MKATVIKIREGRCKGCQFCIHACPRGVLSVSGTLNKRGIHAAVIVSEEKCTGCGMCFLVCPDMAIEIYEPCKK